MASKEALELAKKLIELDLLRDAMLEDLYQLEGDRAEELLRIVQNNW